MKSETLLGVTGRHQQSRDLSVGLTITEPPVLPTRVLESNSQPPSDQSRCLSDAHTFLNLHQLGAGTTSLGSLCPSTLPVKKKHS